MDAEFLAELDRDLTEIGLDEVWKREIGGRTVWISPVPFAGQAVINEKMTDESLGVNFAFETKRLTLSYSIVGIGNTDLRSYRSQGSIFPSQDREGKKVKVTLQRYLYEKMANWGDTWIDATFDVFADLMESHKITALKKIEFENNKPPLDELVELELKAGVLRQEMDMPQMTEVGSEAVGSRTREEIVSPDPDDVSPKGDGPGDEIDFDPFRKVQDENGPVGPQEPAPRPLPGMNGPAGPGTEAAYRRVEEPTASQESPPPVRSVPVPQPPRKASPIEVAVAKRAGKQLPAPVDQDDRTQAILDGQDHEKSQRTPVHSSKEAPFQAQPSIPIETIEQQAERKVVPPPKVNPVTTGQSENPRFRRPGK